MSFFFKVLLSVVASCILLTASLIFLRDEETNWAWVMYEYKNRQAAAIKSPKLVIHGGSATLYGVRAETLAKVTGVPSINMSTSGGFSLPEIIRQAKQVYQKGDWIVLFPEYHLYYGEPSPTQYDFLVTRATDPGNIFKFPLKDILSLTFDTNIVGSITTTITQVLKSPASSMKDINSSGDYELCLDSYKGALVEVQMPNPPHAKTIEELVNLNNWVEKREGHLAVGFPPLVRAPLYDSAAWQLASRALGEKLTRSGLLVLGEPMTSVYDTTQFCNFYYHLNRTGAEIHSNALGKILDENLRAARSRLSKR